MGQQLDYLRHCCERAIGYEGSATHIRTTDGRECSYFLVDIVRLLRKIAIGYRDLENRLGRTVIAMHGRKWAIVNKLPDPNESTGWVHNRVVDAYISERICLQERITKYVLVKRTFK